MAAVAVVSCLYGHGYERFLPAWTASVAALDAGEVIVAADRAIEIPGARVLVAACTWRHPQPFFLQRAILAAESEWVWHLDLDDTALPDALDGIEHVTADVWQMGYERSDGLSYVPPQLTAAEYLTAAGNPFVHASAVRRSSFVSAGGYPDVSFEDWGLWRRMARKGMRFESSGRTHFRYALGDHTRSARELVPADRAKNIEEMLEREQG